MGRSLVIALLALWPGGFRQADPGDFGRDVADRVVLIESERTGGLGAGLVIGAGGDSLLILTAGHVVLDGSDGSLALPMKVSVRWDSATASDVKLVERQTAPLDIAVVQVRAAEWARRLEGQPRLCDRKPVGQERVTTIGHPREERWVINSTNTVLALRVGQDTRRFTISSRGTLGGASGGAVLGENGCYLGVITDADASEAHVTRVEEGLALLNDPDREANLLGGASISTRELREQTYEEISTSLNKYLFSLEAVPALLSQSKIEGDSLGNVSREYSAAYQALYFSRTVHGAKLGQYFGRQRGVEYAALIDRIDAVHKNVVYNRLNEALAALRGAGKLTSKESAKLTLALRDLESQIPALRTATDHYLALLEPLIGSTLGVR